MFSILQPNVGHLAPDARASSKRLGKSAEAELEMAA
jgi:hypothetical protein